jgi:hypothetical protein
LIALTKSIKQEIIDEQQKRNEIHHNIHNLPPPTNEKSVPSTVSHIPETLEVLRSSEFSEYYNDEPKNKNDEISTATKVIDDDGNPYDDNRHTTTSKTKEPTPSKKDKQNLTTTTREILSKQQIGNDDKKDDDLQNNNDHYMLTLNTEPDTETTQNKATHKLDSQRNTTIVVAPNSTEDNTTTYKKKNVDETNKNTTNDETNDNTTETPPNKRTTYQINNSTTAKSDRDTEYDSLTQQITKQKIQRNNQKNDDDTLTPNPTTTQDNDTQTQQEQTTKIYKKENNHKIHNNEQQYKKRDLITPLFSHTTNKGDDDIFKKIFNTQQTKQQTKLTNDDDADNKEKKNKTKKNISPSLYKKTETNTKDSSLRRLPLSPSQKNIKTNEQMKTQQKSNGAPQETHKKVNNTGKQDMDSMQPDSVMKVTPEKRKRSPTEKIYQQFTIAEAMDIDHDVPPQDNIKKQTKPIPNLRQNTQQTTPNIKHPSKYTSQNKVTNNKLMEENDDKITTSPMLAKGHSEINPGENDWYTIEKGKAVKNRTTPKKVAINNSTTNKKKQEQETKQKTTGENHPTPQQKLSQTKTQVTTPQVKSRYHLPPPPAKLYHMLGTQPKTKKETRDGQTWFTTTVKLVVYLREHQQDKPNPSQVLQPLLKIIKQADSTTILLPIESTENKLKDSVHIPEEPEEAQEYVKMSKEGKTLTGVFKIRTQKTLYHIKQHSGVKTYLVNNKTFITSTKFSTEKTVTLGWLYKAIPDYHRQDDLTKEISKVAKIKASAFSLVPIRSTITSPDGQKVVYNSLKIETTKQDAEEN